MAITLQGKRLLKMNYRERQLGYVRLILKHQIFYDLFGEALCMGGAPDKRRIAEKMRQLRVCGENLVERRSSSVRGWLCWIFGLVGDTGF